MSAVHSTNPFPGLRPFREDEEHLFFGREHQVDAMVDKLAATRLLAVVGSSGSGKSSLVNCGLRPALRRGWMARAGSAWRMAQCRPGTAPMRALAQALARPGLLFEPVESAGLTLADMVETSLRMSRLGLVDVYEQAPLAAGHNLLVVVDQFEELFRYRPLAGRRPDHGAAAGEEATAFVNLLLAACAQTVHPIHVVLTMRSDFLGDCTHFPGLAEAMNAGQYLVPRMTRDERRAAIRGPVGVGGAAIAPVLLTRLVNDVGDNPDQLSILQHALHRTWAHWAQHADAGSPLDLPHYEAIGTMAHALDQHAEQAFAELATPRQQRLCERLFKALTDKATDPRGVRRPTALDTLCALADAEQAEMVAVIDVFREPSRSFLMPPAGEALLPATVVDIAHESLMRVWRRLDTWADDEAQSAGMLRRLTDTATLHAAGKASLWRDPDLSQARQWQLRAAPNAAWASRYAPGFELALAFLEDSAAAHAAELAQAQQRQEADRLAKERELAQAKALAEAQRQRADEQAVARIRQRRLSWGLAALVLLAVGAGLYGWQQRGVAQDKQRQAEQQAVIAEEKSADAERARKEAAAQRAQALDNEAEALRQRGEAERQRADAQESATLAAKSADALRKAAHERALEQIRYAWSDLGAKQEQVARIRDTGAQAKLPAAQVQQLVAGFLTVQADDKFNCRSMVAGFRQLYCSVRTVVSFDKLQSIAGLPIFRAGPHKTEFNLRDELQFGHYNPAFLQWLDTYLIPPGLEKDGRLNKLARAAYTAYLQHTVRLLYRTHQVLFASPAEFERFRQRYLEERQRENQRIGYAGSLPDEPEAFGPIRDGYERLLRDARDHPANHPYGTDGASYFQARFAWLTAYAELVWGRDRWTETMFQTPVISGFWVRRSIDGTQAQIFQMVRKLLQTFDPEVLASP